MEKESIEIIIYEENISQGFRLTNKMKPEIISSKK